MFEQDKRPYARQDTTFPRLEVTKAERKKIEVLYQPWTPYKRLGSWLQFIWRF